MLERLKLLTTLPDIGNFSSKEKHVSKFLISGGSYTSIRNLDAIYQ